MFPMRSISEVFLSWDEDGENEEVPSDTDHGDDGDEGGEDTPRHITEVEYRECVTPDLPSIRGTI